MDDLTKNRETTNGNTAYKAVAVKCEHETVNKKITILRKQTEAQANATASYANVSCKLKRHPSNE